MKNRHAGMIFAIIAIIFITIGTFTALYFMTDLLKSNEQLFWKYAFKNVELTKTLFDTNETLQKQWKNTNSYTTEGDLNISITKTTGTQKLKLGTTSKHDQNTNRTYSDVTLYNGPTKLITASYIHNDDIYAIYCNDIYEPYYIGIRNNDLKDFFNKMQISENVTTNIPNCIPFGIKENISKISEKEIKYLSDTYSKIIMDSFSEEKYTKIKKTNITINNLRYETDGYKLTLNQNKVKQMMVNVLTKAKSDTYTIVILNKLLTIEGQTDTTNAQQKIIKLLEKVQSQNFEEMTFDIIVYNAGKNITKTQINFNSEIVISLDIDNSNINKNIAIITIEDIETENTDINMQIYFEKQTISGITNYITNVVNKQNGNTIKMNTTLGNIVNNQIENSSKIAIIDNNTTIETSYYQTIKRADKAIDIQRLTNSSAVIINNYPKNQLDVFLKEIGERTKQVFNNKLENLNIKTTETKDVLYLLEGIASSVLTIASTNEISQPIELLGITSISLFNQSMIEHTSSGNNPIDSLEEKEKSTFNYKFTKYQGTKNGTDVKSLITNVINSNTVYFNDANKKVEIKILGNKIIKPNGWTESGESDVNKLSELRNNISLSEEYSISFKKNTSGYIQVITIFCP